MLAFRSQQNHAAHDKRIDDLIERWHAANPGERIRLREFLPLYDAQQHAARPDHDILRDIGTIAQDARSRHAAQAGNNPALHRWNTDPSSIRDLFDFEHPESGVGAKTTDVHWQPGTGGSVRGVFTQNGQDLPEGQWERTLHFDDAGKGQAYHDLMQLPDAVQDKGFSAAWLNHLLDGYKQSGVGAVHLHANIDVGAYAWAKHGFVPYPSEHAGIVQNWKKYANDLWGAAKLSDADLDKANNVKHIQEIADFDTGDPFPVWTHSAQAKGQPLPGHMGKAFLINTYGAGHPDYAPYRNNMAQAPGWHGSLDLSDGNADYQRGAQYRSAKVKPASSKPALPESVAPLGKAMRFAAPSCPTCCRPHKGEGWHSPSGDDERIHAAALVDDGPKAYLRNFAQSLKDILAR